MRQAFHECGISSLILNFEEDEIGLSAKQNPSDKSELVHDLSLMKLQMFEPTFLRPVPPLYISKDDPVRKIFYYSYN